jgi:hypothetical protein
MARDNDFDAGQFQLQGPGGGGGLKIETVLWSEMAASEVSVIWAPKN